jgi:hypothetical protein
MHLNNPDKDTTASRANGLTVADCRYEEVSHGS